jgi:hypothetical protein
MPPGMLRPEGTRGGRVRVRCTVEAGYMSTLILSQFLWVSFAFSSQIFVTNPGTTEIFRGPSGYERWKIDTL